jgi:processive 1,2-diacylglycerol beta-glucosyltransferase
MSGNETKNKRLLVLTSASGAGHDTHARAIADWCARLYGPMVEVTIAHALEDSHFIYRQGVAFYNFIQRRMPWFHHVYYNLVELLELLNPGTVSLGRDYYVGLLERTRPDAILSVMDCLNRGYFEVAKEILGPKLKCATYATEFAGGYGFSRNWVNPRADFFFARTEEAGREALRRGFSPDKIIVVGHVAPPPFYAPLLSPSEKAAYLRETLHLDPDRFTLLLSTGGAGAQNHAAILRALFPLGDRLQIIALCGRDSGARQQLDAWAHNQAPFPVRALGFSDDMPRLLQVSSAVLARGGATTAGEALLCGCPIIFNGLGGMMPQELPTWRYFEKRGIGSAIFRAPAITPIITRWLDRPEILDQVRARMHQGRDVTTPRRALELLLGPPSPSSI